MMIYQASKKNKKNQKIYTILIITSIILILFLILAFYKNIIQENGHFYAANSEIAFNNNSQKAQTVQAKSNEPINFQSDMYKSYEFSKNVIIPKRYNDKNANNFIFHFQDREMKEVLNNTPLYFNDYQGNGAAFHFLTKDGTNVYSIEQIKTENNVKPFANADSKTYTKQQIKGEPLFTVAPNENYYILQNFTINDVDYPAGGLINLNNATYTVKNEVYSLVEYSENYKIVFPNGYTITNEEASEILEGAREYEATLPSNIIKAPISPERGSGSNSGGSEATIPNTKPVFLAFTAMQVTDTNNVELNWNLSSSNDFAIRNVEIYVDGKMVKSVSPTTKTYTFNDVLVDQYEYQLKAYYTNTGSSEIKSIVSNKINLQLVYLHLSNLNLKSTTNEVIVQNANIVGIGVENIVSGKILLNNNEEIILSDQDIDYIKQYNSLPQEYVFTNLNSNKQYQVNFIFYDNNNNMILLSEPLNNKIKTKKIAPTVNNITLNKVDYEQKETLILTANINNIDNATIYSAEILYDGQVKNYNVKMLSNQKIQINIPLGTQPAKNSKVELKTISYNDNEKNVKAMINIMSPEFNILKTKPKVFVDDFIVDNFNQEITVEGIKLEDPNGAVMSNYQISIYNEGESPIGGHTPIAIQNLEINNESQSATFMSLDDAKNYDIYINADVDRFTENGLQLNEELKNELNIAISNQSKMTIKDNVTQITDLNNYSYVTGITTNTNFKVETTNTINYTFEDFDPNTPLEQGQITQSNSLVANETGLYTIEVPSRFKNVTYNGQNIKSNNPGITNYNFYIFDDVNENFAGVDNNVGHAFAVNEINNLAMISELNTIGGENLNYYLSANINFNNLATDSITSTFKGNFDGNGYQLINFNSQTGGLFDSLENAKINNLQIINANVEDGLNQNNNTGVLANTAINTNINNIVMKETTLTTSKSYHVGGLVGEGENLIIQNVANTEFNYLATANNNTNINVGGIAGILTDTNQISETYVYGDLTTTNLNETTLAGIVGLSIGNLNIESVYTTLITIANNQSSITNFYGLVNDQMGSITNIVNSFAYTRANLGNYNEIKGITQGNTATYNNVAWFAQATNVSGGSYDEPKTPSSLFDQNFMEGILSSSEYDFAIAGHDNPKVKYSNESAVIPNQVNFTIKDAELIIYDVNIENIAQENADLKISATENGVQSINEIEITIKNLSDPQESPQNIILTPNEIQDLKNGNTITIDLQNLTPGSQHEIEINTIASDDVKITGNKKRFTTIALGLVPVFDTFTFTDNGNQTITFNWTINNPDNFTIDEVKLYNANNNNEIKAVDGSIFETIVDMSPGTHNLYLQGQYEEYSKIRYFTSNVITVTVTPYLPPVNYPTGNIDLSISNLNIDYNYNINDNGQIINNSKVILKNNQEIIIDTDLISPGNGSDQGSGNFAVTVGGEYKIELVTEYLGQNIILDEVRFNVIELSQNNTISYLLNVPQNTITDTTAKLSLGVTGNSVASISDITLKLNNLASPFNLLPNQNYTLTMAELLEVKSGSVINIYLLALNPANEYEVEVITMPSAISVIDKTVQFKTLSEINAPKFLNFNAEDLKNQVVKAEWIIANPGNYTIDEVEIIDSSNGAVVGVANGINNELQFALPPGTYDLYAKAKYNNTEIISEKSEVTVESINNIEINNQVVKSTSTNSITLEALELDGNFTQIHEGNVVATSLIDGTVIQQPLTDIVINELKTGNLSTPFVISGLNSNTEYNITFEFKTAYNISIPVVLNSGIDNKGVTLAHDPVLNDVTTSMLDYNKSDIAKFNLNISSIDNVTINSVKVNYNGNTEIINVNNSDFISGNINSDFDLNVGSIAGNNKSVLVEEITYTSLAGSHTVLISTPVDSNKFSVLGDMPSATYGSITTKPLSIEITDVTLSDLDNVVQSNYEAHLYVLGSSSPEQILPLNINSTPQNIIFDNLIGGTDYNIKIVADIYDYNSNQIINSDYLITDLGTISTPPSKVLDGWISAGVVTANDQMTVKYEIISEFNNKDNQIIVKNKNGIIFQTVDLVKPNGETSGEVTFDLTTALNDNEHYIVELKTNLNNSDMIIASDVIYTAPNEAAKEVQYNLNVTNLTNDSATLNISANGNGVNDLTEIEVNVNNTRGIMRKISSHSITGSDLQKIKDGGIVQINLANLQDNKDYNIKIAGIGGINEISTNNQFKTLPSLDAPVFSGFSAYVNGDEIEFVWQVNNSEQLLINEFNIYELGNQNPIATVSGTNSTTVFVNPGVNTYYITLEYVDNNQNVNTIRSINIDVATEEIKNIEFMNFTLNATANEIIVPQGVNISSSRNQISTGSITATPNGNGQVITRNLTPAEISDIKSGTITNPISLNAFSNTEYTVEFTFETFGGLNIPTTYDPVGSNTVKTLNAIPIINSASTDKNIYNKNEEIILTANLNNVDNAAISEIVVTFNNNDVVFTVDQTSNYDQIIARAIAPNIGMIDADVAIKSFKYDNGREVVDNTLASPLILQDVTIIKDLPTVTVDSVTSVRGSNSIQFQGIKLQDIDAAVVNNYQIEIYKEGESESAGNTPVKTQPLVINNQQNIEVSNISLNTYDIYITANINIGNGIIKETLATINSIKVLPIADFIIEDNINVAPLPSHQYLSALGQSLVMTNYSETINYTFNDFINPETNLAIAPNTTFDPSNPGKYVFTLPTSYIYQYNGSAPSSAPTVTFYIFPEFSISKQLVDNSQINSFGFGDSSTYALAMDAMENGAINTNFYQTANIDLSTLPDISHHSMDVGTYRGNFDGQGYEIKNYQSEAGGIFAILNGATINNVHLTDSVINKTGGVSGFQNVGNIANRTSGGTVNIKNTTVTNYTINIQDDISRGVGGLVGEANSNVNINNSLTQGSINVENGLNATYRAAGFITSWHSNSQVININNSYAYTNLNDQRLPTAPFSQFSGLGMAIDNGVYNIKNSYAFNNITSTSNVGGGGLLVTRSVNSTINDSFVYTGTQSVDTDNINGIVSDGANVTNTAWYNVQTNDPGGNITTPESSRLDFDQTFMSSILGANFNYSSNLADFSNPKVTYTNSQSNLPYQNDFNINVSFTDLFINDNINLAAINNAEYVTSLYQNLEIINISEPINYTYDNYLTPPTNDTLNANTTFNTTNAGKYIFTLPRGYEYRL